MSADDAGELTNTGAAGLRVLLIGSGGREHALAHAITASPRLEALWVAPGNPGTSKHNLALDISDHDALIAQCRERSIDLVVVGPEGPLVAGIADALTAAGIACFGPSAAAAQLEGSKSFAREFADRHGIPGPRHARFDDIDAALAYVDREYPDALAQPAPVVIKADGLAAGKGVIVPESRTETEAAIRELIGTAGRPVVIEERMEGPEISLFGISSARKTDPLGGLTARDHKRVGEGDTGPNTGGMGAFAPVPGLSESFISELVDTFLVPVTQGMAAEGTPYVGVIYAGLMLTAQGPRLVEYNCRFGDPEAQVLLPLLDGDLLEVMYRAATDQDWEPLVARQACAVTVVIAARGYPGEPVRGVPIPTELLTPADRAVTVIHAGTQDLDGSVVSAGGRVLNVVAHAPDLSGALRKAYAVVNPLTDNDDLFARSDIGASTLDGAAGGDAYAAAGVSFDAGAAAINQIADAVKSTHNERVVAGVGSFGGVFDIGRLGMDAPLLVSSTDTCGTKTVLAAQLNAWDGIGADIVNHGINDVLVQGARPLFMLDTISAGVLDPDIVGAVVRSMAAACAESGCVLLGGETAEVPDLIYPGGVDVAGTMVGVVDRSKLLPSPEVNAGDVLIGLASSGLHTNGYSLARRLGAEAGFDTPVPGGDGVSIGAALLAPHRSYLAPLSAALDADVIKALAHLTGGGFLDNIPRCLPDGLGATVNTRAWETPPLFAWLADAGGLSTEESHRIFNMGIGMVAVVDPANVEAFQSLVPESTWIIGEVVEGDGVTLS